MRVKDLKLPQDKKYEQFVKERPCLVCQVGGVDPHHLWHNRSCSYVCVPLCRAHHTEFHSIQWEAFEEKYNLCIKEELIKLLAVYIYKRLDLKFDSAKDLVKFYQEFQ